MLVYVLLNNVNGKCYVGQTVHYRLYKRWNKRPSICKANPHLASAIRKYGPENFSQKILCYATCEEELNLLERFFIALLQSSNPAYGYNKTLGGEPARHFTKEIREVLADRMREVWKRGVHRDHAAAVRRWWRRLSKGERRLIRLRQSLARSGQSIKGHTPWNKGKRGIQSGRKGRTFGPQENPCRRRKAFTEEHKQRISEALRRYHAQRRGQAKGRGR
jgi:group I intron endonuclease